MAKVLLLSDCSNHADCTTRHLDDNQHLDVSEIVHASTPSHAIELLGSEPFDSLMLCNADGDTDSLRRYLYNEHIVDCVPLGVALLDVSQRIITANDRLADLLKKPVVAGADFFESLGRYKLLEFGPNPFHAALESGTSSQATIELADRYFSLCITPVIEADRSCEQLVATLRESTEQVLQQQKSEALHQAGSVLTDLRPEEIYQMDFEQRIELLKDNIHHYAKDLLDFDVVEIRVLHSDTMELRPLLSVGMDSGITHRMLYANREGNGVTGFVAATGVSYLCEDTNEDPLYVDGLVGAKSSLTVPLKYHDEIVGTFNVESPEVNRFTTDDLKFLESFGRYIAIALNTLELLNAQKTNATLKSVEAIRHAVNIPIDEILNHTVHVIETFIGHDSDITKRLDTIAALARDIKNSICKVGDGLAPPDAVSGCVKVQQNPRLNDKQVLVIDGDENVRTSAHELLERYGCIVETAHSGEEAMMMVRDAAKRRHYDAIIADIRLPDVKGYELLNRLKDYYNDPPMVLMTGFGYDPGHSIPKAREAGLRANALLYKPFRLEQLLDTVEATVALTDRQGGYGKTDNPVDLSDSEDHRGIRS